MKNRMKSLLCLLLAIVLLATALPFAVAESTDDGFEYEVANGEATITNYTGDATELVIPDTLGGAPVTTIGAQAFLFLPKLESVTIPGCVKTIGEWAFGMCDNLSQLTISNGVTTIGEAAFGYCAALTDVIIPASVATLHNAFFNSALTAFVVDENNADFSSEDGVLFNEAQTKLIQYPSKKLGSAYTIPNNAFKGKRRTFHKRNC